MKNIDTAQEAIDWHLNHPCLSPISVADRVWKMFMIRRNDLINFRKENENE